MIEDQIPEQPTNAPVFQEDASRPNWRLWLAAGGCSVLVCAALFVGAIIYAGPERITKFLPAGVKTAEEQYRESVQNNSMGDPNAPVKIIEYGDFQCPYCLEFWKETEPQLIKQYINTGKVYFEFRSYAFLGPESIWAAEGAYCAGDQGKFWEFHDTLFTNWTGENAGDFTQEKLIQYADALGLDIDEFESCLSEEKYKSKVEQDKAEGEAQGVNATPTFIINGYILEGAHPFDVFQHIIEEILNGDFETLTG